jgi:uncharacterized repeat protein (TIGR03803 family)
VLYAFERRSDGARPYSSLVRDAAGNLYGTTYYGGGIDDFGTVFELSPPASKSGSWTEKIVYAFQGPGVGDGFAPNGGLYLTSAGVLFGTTVYGGTGAYGTVFMLTPPKNLAGAWKEKVLYGFIGGVDGGEPFAGLVRDSKGVLYGTTVLGGADSLGTVFSVSEKNGIWSESVVHSFEGGEDGTNPESPLSLDTSGNLYGTAPTGGGESCITGSVGCGVLFVLSPDRSGGWNETIIHTFEGNADGSQPYGALTLSGSNIWGTTLSGGDPNCGPFVGYGCGAVYNLRNVSGSWNEHVMYSFQGGSDGSSPYSGVALSNGKLYGTTNLGGSSDLGTVFEI